MTESTNLPQHLAALERANQVRYAQAALRRRIAAGEITVADLLDPEAELPPYSASMPLGRLLGAQSYWGQRRVGKITLRLGVSERKPIGSLTARQRRCLIELLGGAYVDDRLLAA